MKPKRHLFVFLILICFMSTSLFVPQTQASGEDWLWGWGYRRAITITGSAGAGTNYQVSITVTLNQTVMQDDYDDIRFTNDGGMTELDYWMEEYGQDSASFWVNVTANLDTDQTIYMYSGKQGVSTTSNGEDTFIWFDDFSTDKLSKTGTSIAVSGGELHWDSNSNYGDGEVTIPVVTSFAMNNHFNWDNAPNVANFYIMVRDAFGTSYGDFNDAIGYRLYDDDRHIYSQRFESTVSGGVEYDSVMTLDTDYWGQMTYDGTDMTVDIYSDYWTTTVGTQLTQTFTYGNDLDVLSYSTRNVPSNDGESDYIFIRKFTTPEPVFASWGEQETAPPKSWQSIGNEARFIFVVGWDPTFQFGYDAFFIFLGLILIPLSTMYLVKGGKEEMSSDKLFYFLIVFMIGFGLLVGGIMP